MQKFSSKIDKFAKKCRKICVYEKIAVLLQPISEKCGLMPRRNNIAE